MQTLIYLAVRATANYQRSFLHKHKRMQDRGCKYKCKSARECDSLGLHPSPSIVHRNIEKTIHSPRGQRWPSIMAVEPAITAAIASGNMPSTITANYLMETRDHPARIALTFVGALTFVVVLLRCISRLFLVRSFGLDDGLAAFSMVRSIPLSIRRQIIILPRGQSVHHARRD